MAGGASFFLHLLMCEFVLDERHFERYYPPLNNCWSRYITPRLHGPIKGLQRIGALESTWYFLIRGYWGSFSVALPKDPPIIFQEGDSDELMKPHRHTLVSSPWAQPQHSMPRWFCAHCTQSYERFYKSVSRPPELNQPDYSRFLSLTPEPALFGTQGS
jgi:hypothetical protein